MQIIQVKHSNLQGNEPSVNKCTFWLIFSLGLEIGRPLISQIFFLAENSPTSALYSVNGAFFLAETNFRQIICTKEVSRRRHSAVADPGQCHGLESWIELNMRLSADMGIPDKDNVVESSTACTDDTSTDERCLETVTALYSVLLANRRVKVAPTRLKRLWHRQEALQVEDQAAQHLFTGCRRIQGTSGEAQRLCGWQHPSRASICDGCYEWFGISQDTEANTSLDDDGRCFILHLWTRQEKDYTIWSL